MVGESTAACGVPAGHGTDDVDAIERRFGGDLGFEDLVLHGGVADGQLEVLADFVLIELHTDRGGTHESPACDTISDLVEFQRGRFEERLALVSPELREFRITARNVPLLGIRRIRELERIDQKIPRPLI
jgi:hypothetical protein